MLLQRCDTAYSLLVFFGHPWLVAALPTDEVVPELVYIVEFYNFCSCNFERGTAVRCIYAYIFYTHRTFVSKTRK